MISAKRYRRILLVASSAGYTLMPALLQIAFSLLVIRLAGLALWGAFVEVLIILNLLLHLLNWGARDYLLSRFALSPAKIAAVWQHSIVSRIPLLLLILVLILITPMLSGNWLILCVWLISAYVAQAFDAIVIYEKAFARAIIINLITILALLGITVFFSEALSLSLLILAYALFHVLRAALFSLQFRKFWRRIVMLPESATSFYRAAFPFFLLGFTGLLQSKTDLYCLAIFSDQDMLARYQIFVNALAYLQVVGYLLIQPFAKAVLRMPFAGVWRLTNRMAVLGAFLVVLVLPLIVYAVKTFYLVEISSGLAISGALMVLPIFVYTPLIYFLYGRNRQNQVVWVNIPGILVNLGLNVLLIPSLKMTGAMIASASAQWMMLALYLIVVRRIKKQIAGKTT